MKLLIYGSNGWIGEQFIKMIKKNYNENITIFEGKSRCNNKNDILQEIKSINPTHIISFIGRTHGIINNKNYGTIDYLWNKKEREKILEIIYIRR